MSSTINHPKDVEIDINLKREQWLEARQVGIGSTDAPVIVGVSPYKSALELYHEKRGTVRPHPGEVEALRWGNILERPIARRYSEETRREVAHLSEPDRFTILRNKVRRWQHATIDGLVVAVLPTAADPVAPRLPAPSPGVLEVKNVSSYVGERWKDEPPIEFIVQVQHQLAVTGALWGSIAALVGGVIFLWTDIPRDEAFIEKLIELEREFLDRVEAGDEPPADGSASAKEFLRWLYPKDTGTLVHLSPEWLDVESDWLEAKRQIKHWSGVKRELENRLRQAIGEHTYAHLPNGSVFSLKTQQRREHVVKASEFRVLRHRETKTVAPAGAAALALPEVVESDGGSDEE